MDRIMKLLSILLLAFSTSASALTLDFEIGVAGDFVDFQYTDVVITSNSADHKPMLFDSANPAGDDFDLATDSEGMILIISEDNDQLDPDDNWKGGVLSFDFSRDTYFSTITLVDIDHNEPGGTVQTFHQGNLVEVLPIVSNGNNSLTTLVSNSNMAIDMIEVDLFSSGGIALIQTSEEVPEPASVALLLMGLTGLVYKKRKQTS